MAQSQEHAVLEVRYELPKRFGDRLGRGVEHSLNAIDAERMDKVTIYTDGACKGNPGPGGVGALLIAGEHQKSCLAAKTTPPIIAWS